jgi:glucosamine--fructose-6-phosphate aminotransferase (isomerizing)
MCGIIGYVGTKAAAPVLLEGLRRLEYRGYDSAGIAVLHDGALLVRKRAGKIDEGIARELIADPVTGEIGIAHTRWATHGPPSDENSHPHLDRSGRIAVVHNGVIENFEQIKQRLLKTGHEFRSSTDTEVLAHLIGEHYEQCTEEVDTVNPLTRAVRDALREVIGTYGIAVICTEQPGVIVGARRGSPLIIGIGDGENFLTSDANAVVAHTRQVVFLSDYDVATVTRDSFEVMNLGTDTADVQISKLEFDAEDSQRGDYEHFMLKEIHEQPRTVENALRGRIDHEGATAILGGLNMTAA